MKTYRIVEMGTHFLYLPLYYALGRKCFGFLPTDVEIKTITSPSHSDLSAVESLISGQIDDEQVLFAVCDPTVVAESTSQGVRRIQVLAALVTNMAFWAVDSGRRTTNTFRDLGKFDEIITYAEGSSSHAIAKRLQQINGGSRPRIITVKPGRELVSLKERIRARGTSSSPSTIALSPDVLAIGSLLPPEEKLCVESDLGKTPEFSGVLITAILTRETVLVKNRDVCVGLARAIQHSLLLIHGRHPDVIEYAKERFGVDQKRVEAAVELALESQVFPTTIEINEGQWLRTSECWVTSIGGKFDESGHSAAKKTFDATVRPFSLEAREVFRKSLTQPDPSGSDVVSAAGEKPTNRRKEAIIAFLFLMALIIAAAPPVNAIGNRGWIVEAIAGVGAIVFQVMLSINNKKARLSWGLLAGVTTAFMLVQLTAYANLLPAKWPSYLSALSVTTYLGIWTRYLTRNEKN